MSYPQQQPEAGFLKGELRCAGLWELEDSQNFVRLGSSAVGSET